MSRASFRHKGEMYHAAFGLHNRKFGKIVCDGVLERRPFGANADKGRDGAWPTVGVRKLTAADSYRKEPHETTY